MTSAHLVGLLSIVASYLLGSVLFGVLVARRYGVELGKVGSGNLGASNVIRSIGRIGYLVLALDLFKGLLPSLGAGAYFGDERLTAALVGGAAALGHCYSVFFGFRGGKGAATGAGVILAFWPLAGGAALIAFGIVRALSRKASLGSLAGVLVALAIISYESVTIGLRPFPLGLAVFLAALIAWRHRSNLQRLWNKEENDA